MNCSPVYKLSDERWGNTYHKPDEWHIHIIIYIYIWLCIIVFVWRRLIQTRTEANPYLHILYAHFIRKYWTIANFIMCQFACLNRRRFGSKSCLVWDFDYHRSFIWLSKISGKCCTNLIEDVALGSIGIKFGGKVLR